MTIEVWFAFLAAIVVLFLIPGPIMIFVISESVNSGMKSILPVVSGVSLGIFVAMSLSILGLGAILATSATLFLALKWFGVCYLVYLGVKTWNQEPQDFSNNTVGSGCTKKVFSTAFLVAALNPKDIIFYVAFFPQFISAGSETVSPILILMATFLFVDILFVLLFAVFSQVVRARISGVNAQKNINKAGGGALIGAGLVTATMQRV